MFETDWDRVSERIWAGHHADAPAPWARGLLEAEEDDGRQLREGHHQRAQVAAHVVCWAHLLDDVVRLSRTIILAEPRPRLGHAQWHGTVLGRHGDAAAA